jgi:hypothetical protein
VDSSCAEEWEWNSESVIVFSVDVYNQRTASRNAVLFHHQNKRRYVMRNTKLSKRAIVVSMVAAVGVLFIGATIFIGCEQNAPISPGPTPQEEQQATSRGRKGLLTTTSNVNLIRNPSFEDTPCTTPCNQDQAVMPSEWLSLNVTPDTYSNDGSYGLPPNGFGNFTGATAQDGIRWVAGWSAIPEIFGQVLTAPLTPGEEYTLSAYLRKAVRPDLANPGTYQVELWNSTVVATANKVVIGSFQPLIDNQSAWEIRSLTFIAPPEVATHSVLAFRPLDSGAGTAYPGFDNVVLCASPTDDDGDGILNSEDDCPNSNLNTNVVIDGCDSGVPNILLPSGCTIADLIAQCAAGANSHDEFVSCVADLTNNLVRARTITGRQKGAIQRCAAQANIP